jgi:hypothetical protein
MTYQYISEPESMLETRHRGYTNHADCPESVGRLQTSKFTTGSPNHAAAASALRPKLCVTVGTHDRIAIAGRQAAKLRMKRLVIQLEFEMEKKIVHGKK